MRIGSATFAGLKGFSSDSPRSSAERRHHKRGAPALDSLALEALEFKAAGLRDPDGGGRAPPPGPAGARRKRKAGSAGAGINPPPPPPRPTGSPTDTRGDPPTPAGRGGGR